jgi:hypothetical protein
MLHNDGESVECFTDARDSFGPQILCSNAEPGALLGVLDRVPDRVFYSSHGNHIRWFEIDTSFAGFDFFVFPFELDKMMCAAGVKRDIVLLIRNRDPSALRLVGWHA